MKYKKTTIGAHCNVTSSKRFHLSERSTSGVPFYCSKEIIQIVNGGEITECDFIKEDAYERIKRQFGVPQTGDLLITTRGTYGIPYIYKADDYFYFADGNLTWLKDFDDELIPKYLYYWVRSYEGQKKIDAIAKGTAQKAVPIAAIKMIELEIPNADIQKKVVRILATYDDLIENNQKQIKLLEEAAQRLYKEWFVDLRFPGYEDVKNIDGVPNGWRNAQLGDVIDINKENISKNYSYDHIDYIDISSVRIGTILNTNFYTLADAPGRAKRCIHDGDVLWGMVRPNLKSYALIMNPTSTMIASTGFAVLTPKSIPFTFLYCLVTQEAFVGYLINCTNGAAYPAVKPIHFQQSPVLIPTDELLNQFHLITEPLFRKIDTLHLQINILTEARDRLLPKLMSGELEV